MPKTSDSITKEGTVVESLPGLTFRVKLDDGKEILAYLGGRMRLYRIRVSIGNRVKIEMSPYDDSKGRIVYRNK